VPSTDHNLGHTLQHFWDSKPVLVTGGASFIGSHLVERLVSLGAIVRVVDDFSSGRLENLSTVSDQIEIVEGDLKSNAVAAKAVTGQNTVFHLAASHGGRGYIETHPADCATNLALDTIVFEASNQAGVERVCFASSACVYPKNIQQHKTLLQEDMVSLDVPGGAFSDAEYGWAKLMGEMTLKAFHRQHGLKCSSVRYFTAYGPRCNESHAIIAFIAKALSCQSPFNIWGDGKQTRNFTYVDDIVEATLLAAENIEDGTAVNAGTSNFNSIEDVARLVCKMMDYLPEQGFSFSNDKPTGPLHRAADTSRAELLMGWKPSYGLEQGVVKTIDWYTRHVNAKTLAGGELEKRLMDR
jgi:nucleoside-diphosphate-sugar epimerase